MNDLFYDYDYDYFMTMTMTMTIVLNLDTLESKSFIRMHESPI